LTQNKVDNNHILDIDATPKACNREVKNKKIQLVEYDTIVRSEIIANLLFSWLEHEDVVSLIKSYLWMKPLMNYSFPLDIQEISLFPTAF
jgi:ATP:corrinoid adenosyltransferase